jgi:hypothetical protein
MESLNIPYASVHMRNLSGQNYHWGLKKKSLQNSLNDMENLLSYLIKSPEIG